MNVGWPGAFARNPDDIVVARQVSVGPINPGDPAVLVGATNTFAPFGAANVFADFAGFATKAVRNAIQFAGPQPEAPYAVGDVADVLERGNINVLVRRGAPVAGGPVYVRTVLGVIPDAGAVVGGIEAAVPADGGASVQLLNCEWATGVIDANGICEVCVKTRNRA
jgi:hypothetical protein